MNDKPPGPRVNFIVAGVLSIVGFIIFLFRVRNMKKKVEGFGAKFEGPLFIRGIITCLIDDDEPAYVIISFSAISMIILGFLQLDYQIGYFCFIGYSALITAVEGHRTLLAYVGAKDLSDVLVSSIIMKNENLLSVKLNPINVYEDLARSFVIVSMVWVTQVILVSLIIYDLYLKDTTDCFDGTVGCPVVGTLTSWSLYLLGLFMVLVYKLGPRGKFGNSPQDPAYWLQLLLCVKNDTSTLTWYDHVKHKTATTKLFKPNVFVRFCMSTSINGFAFRLLLHSLPIQTSNRNTLISVVLSGLFMIFLIDLDDTHCFPITVSHPNEKSEDEKNKIRNSDENSDEQEQAPLNTNSNEINIQAVANVSEEIEKILDEARAKIDLLSKKHNIDIPPQHAKHRRDNTVDPHHAKHNLVGGDLVLTSKNIINNAVAVAQQEISIIDGYRRQRKADYNGAYNGADNNRLVGANAANEAAEMDVKIPIKGSSSLSSSLSSASSRPSTNESSSTYSISSTVFNC